MSCCSTLRTLGSGIVSMFSPTPCHTCPEPEVIVPPTPGEGFDGFLLMGENGHVLMTESGHVIAIN